MWGSTVATDSGVAPLDIAIEVTDELGLPVMAHLDYPPPSRTAKCWSVCGPVMSLTFTASARFINAPVMRPRRTARRGVGGCASEA